MFQLSYKILRFNFYQSSLITYINTPAGIIRYGLTPPQVAAIAAFTASWAPDFRNYVNVTRLMWLAKMEFLILFR